MPPTENIPDSREHVLRFVKHKKVFKSNHLDPVTAQKKLSLVIMKCDSIVLVHLTIQLDGEPLGRTIEVENVIVDAMLPSEFSSFELRSLQIFPEACFRRREVFAQFGAECLQVWTSMRAMVAGRPRARAIWFYAVEGRIRFPKAPLRV